MQLHPLLRLCGPLTLLVSCGGAQRPTDLPPVEARPATTSAEAAPAARTQNGTAPDQVGLATWYGAALAGHRTSSGERFDPSALTAAHRKLPLGTWVEVRSVDTGRTVRGRINDRGPWGDDRRIIDLSRAAADQLGMRRHGVFRVELYVVRRAP